LAFMEPRSCDPDDPVEIGLVQSFSRPSGNLTGIYGLLAGMGPGATTKYGAAVLPFLSNLPMTAELVAIIFNRSSLRRLQRDHDELTSGLRLEVGKLLFKRSLGCRVEHARFIDHAAREWETSARRPSSRKRARTPQGICCMHNIGTAWSGTCFGGVPRAAGTSPYN
jgi:hypothetical protein